MGSYAEWTEAAKLAWLTTELHSKRPLVPNKMPMEPEVGCWLLFSIQSCTSCSASCCCRHSMC